MKARFRKTVAHALVALIALSFSIVLPDCCHGTMENERIGSLTSPNAIHRDRKTVNAKWVEDGGKQIPSYLSKIEAGLLEKIVHLGSQVVKVIVLADNIPVLHQAFEGGRFRLGEDYVLGKISDLGTTTLDVPANMIPKIASLPNVEAILEYRLPDPPEPKDFLRGAPMNSGESPQPEMRQVTLIQGAEEAWALGFLGRNVKVAVLDTGVDFGNPDLEGTQARVENPASPYFGWPIAFDSRSMRRFLETRKAFPDSDVWFSDTSTTDIDQDSDGVLDNSGYVVTNITSQSGIYHLGEHPDDFLRFRIGGYAKVLVVDSQIAGEYDEVYVDLNNDFSFADEKAATRGDEVLVHDLDSDGFADLSGGLVYFVADGVNPIPYSEFIAQDMGISNIIPGNGSLVAFMLNDATEAGGSHGTLCASAISAQGRIAGGAVKGMAPEARVISVGNIYQGGNWFDNYYFSVEGYDGIPNTGDEANILSMSFGISSVINKGWSFDARLVDELTTYYAPNATFMVAAGNGGYGYGTVVSPGSSPGVVTVGASTSFWTAEPANYTTHGDIISWSDRGPNALGQVDPDVLSTGAWASGDITVNQASGGNSAWGVWGGTSLATPVAAGIMALLYESYLDAHGAYPSSAVAREIIMSSADSIHYDSLSQGSGIANASRAVRLANERYGIHISPSFWTVGDYRGTHYESFANLVLPGGSYTYTFQVYNADQRNASQISISDVTHVRTKTLFYSIESNTSQEDGIQWNRPDYLIPLVDYKRGLSEVPIGTDLVKASAYFDYFDFDPDWDYGIENRYSLALYDWWDEDGDGLYWNDSNGDGVVQREEIDGYPNFSEIKRFVDSGQAANRYEARVHNPHQRIHDGLLIGVFHTRTTAMRPVTNVSIRVDSYELMDCNWLDVSASTLAIPPGGRSSFQATVAFPSDAGLGLYEAFLLLSYDSNETAVPITANLAADSSDFLISESSGELYDNGAVFGGYNWGWRYESGDWRFYFLDVPEGSFKQGQQLVVNVSWEHVPTDVDVFLLGGEIDDFSTNHPERYGPYYMETRGGSEDYWAGAGKFLFNTVTGGPQEIVAADLSPGLWEIVLHNVLNAGRSSIENISVDVGTIEINPNPWEIGLVRDFSRLVGRQQFITNSSLNLPDIEVSSFGVSQPIQFTEETILQDNPSDPSTSSWSYELDIQDGGLLEVYTDSARPIDIDLYLLRDENSNGLPDWGTEIIASSTSPTEKESVSIKRPSNGKYWVFVHGWSIGGFSSTFDISIDAIQGRDIGVSEVPTGPIVAYEPVSFNASYSLPAVDGLYHGIIFAGPSSAPGVLSVRFYGEVRDYPPEFYNLTPPPGSIVNNNQPMIGADFLDTGSGMNLSSLQLFVDGFNISNLANITRDSISWSTPFLLTEGPHWVSISARDNFGNENLTTWSFTVDTFPPYLNVVEPIDGLVTRISLLSVSGWTENDASLTINEVPTPVSPNGSFSAFVVLTEGKNVISVQSRDRAGNYERINRTVVLDTIPPLLDVTEPSDGVWINYPTVVVRGRTEPGALISVGGQLADVGPNGSFEMSVALIEGPNRITVTATDPAGNIATSQISVNVDTKPPYLLLESPREGLLTNMQSLSIYGGTEPSVSLEINGVSMPVHPDGSFSTTALLSEGQNIIYVNVTDLAGNSNSIQRVVTLDSIEPPLEILKPVEGLVTTHHSIRLQGRSEPNVSLMVNSQLFLVESDGSFDVVLALSEGINTLLVRVCDMANNCNNDQRTVLVDSAPPTADAGEDSVVFVGMEYRFDGSGSTDNDRIVSYYWFFTEGGTEIKLEGSSPSYLFDEMDEYEIVLIVTDRAGNMDEDVLRITVVSRYDSDSDKLLDAWENDYFGGLDYDALDDPDLDGLSNYAELMKGSDPTNPDSDGDGIVDGLDDYPLQRKGLRVEDFWWLFVLITVALLVLTIYLQLRIRKISSGEGVELSKETETSKEKEVKEPTTKEGRS